MSSISIKTRNAHVPYGAINSIDRGRWPISTANTLPSEYDDTKLEQFEWISGRNDLAGTFMRKTWIRLLLYLVAATQYLPTWYPPRYLGTIF